MKALFNAIGEALDVYMDATEAAVRAIAPRTAGMLQLYTAAVKEASAALDGTKLPAAVIRYSKLQDTVTAAMAPHIEEIMAAAAPLHEATEELRKKFRKARGIDDAMVERLEALGEAFDKLSYAVHDQDAADRVTDLAAAAAKRPLTGEEVAEVSALEAKLATLQTRDRDLAQLQTEQEEVRALPWALVGCTLTDVRLKYSQRHAALCEALCEADRTAPATEAELKELRALQELVATFTREDEFGAVAMHRKF